MFQYTLEYIVEPSRTEVKSTQLSSTVQYRTVQYRSVQYSTVQYSMHRITKYNTIHAALPVPRGRALIAASSETREADSSNFNRDCFSPVLSKSIDSSKLPLLAYVCMFIQVCVCVCVQVCVYVYVFRCVQVFGWVCARGQRERDREGKKKRERERERERERVRM